MPKIYKYGKYKKQMKKIGAKTVATRKEFSLVQSRMETAAFKKKKGYLGARTTAVKRIADEALTLKKRGEY